MVGVVTAVLAAVGFAVFQTVNRRALAAVDVYRGTAVVLGVGALLLLVVAGLTGGLALVPAAPATSLGLFALAGFIHFFCGWTLLGLSQVRIGAARTGVLLGAMPLVGAVLAALFLDEPLTAATIAGLVLVVVGVVIVVSRGGVAELDPGQARWGVVAGLATSLCWSISPVLIRRGLEGLPSPVAGAAFGMVASAAVYGLAVVVTGRGRQRLEVGLPTRRLLVWAGIAVSLSIWMQWTAFALAPIAVVLGLLQLTPLLVVALAVFVGVDALDRTQRRRVWTGAVVTVAGSSLLVLLG